MYTDTSDDLSLQQWKTVYLIESKNKNEKEREEEKINKISKEQGPFLFITR